MLCTSHVSLLFECLTLVLRMHSCTWRAPTVPSTLRLGTFVPMFFTYRHTSYRSLPWVSHLNAICTLMPHESTLYEYLKNLTLVRYWNTSYKCFILISRMNTTFSRSLDICMAVLATNTSQPKLTEPCGFTYDDGDVLPCRTSNLK